MKKKILITGGAGFIGSNLALKLSARGYNVTVLDNLSDQIHGSTPESTSPLYKSIINEVEFIKGDVTNREILESAIEGVNYIVHFAAETGTGQSMYKIEKYVNVNVYGTSLLLDIITNRKNNIEKIILASSRAIYGEGKYYCETHGLVYPQPRNEIDLKSGDFNCKCPDCNKDVSILPTCEHSTANPYSIYAITKYNQEQMILAVSKALGIPSVIFRYQNVYGPGQSLSNPYTGILSIFSTQIRNGNNITVFEDGMESRDFVYIDDVVNATILGLENKKADYEVFNVGSGVAVTVLEVADQLNRFFDNKVTITISGKFRIGDIRHNCADITKIRRLLDFNPQINFKEGLEYFSKWVKTQPIPIDRYDDSIRELNNHNLFK